MTKRERSGLARHSDMFFVDRLLYEKRPGGGRFVTFTRKAQLRLLAVFLSCLVLAVGSTTGLVLGYRLYERQSRALAELQAGLPAAGSGAQALAEARTEIDGLRAALEEARSRPSDERALEDMRAALEVEKRTITAALETAETKAKLLAEQLESAERSRQKLEAELAERPLVAGPAASADGDGAQAQLESLTLELTMVRHERDTARSELQAAQARVEALQQEAVVRQPAPAAAPAEAEQLHARLAALTQENQRLQADLAELDRLRGENESLLAGARVQEQELAGLRERLAAAEAQLAGYGAAAKLEGGPQPADEVGDVAASLAKLKELGDRLKEIEARNASLEAFVVARSPAPPERAPRR
jgi:chromosome segregation ATPase